MEQNLTENIKQQADENIPLGAPVMFTTNTIYHENCLETMERMPASFVDLIVTSPPYFNAQKKYQRGKGIHYTQDVGEPLYSIMDTFEAATRILKEDGFYCINLGFSYGETGILRPFYVIERALKFGLFAIDVIIWKKKNPIPIQKRLTNAFEYIFVLAKHPHSEYPSSERIGYQHNFIETSVAAVKGHNAVFPEEIPKFCIEVFSNENDLVYDPFVGSGTTCKVASQMNRKWIGSDISKDYCELALSRIQNLFVE